MNKKHKSEEEICSIYYQSLLLTIFCSVSSILSKLLTLRQRRIEYSPRFLQLTVFLPCLSVEYISNAHLVQMKSDSYHRRDLKKQMKTMDIFESFHDFPFHHDMNMNMTKLFSLHD